MQSLLKHLELQVSLIMIDSICISKKQTQLHKKRILFVAKSLPNMVTSMSTGHNVYRQFVFPDHGVLTNEKEEQVHKINNVTQANTGKQLI